MYLNTPSMYDSSLIFGMATLKRTKNRRASAVPNARKMYEEAQMTRRVKSYLSNIPSIKEEDKLAELSNICEPQGTANGMVLYQLLYHIYVSIMSTQI